MKSYRLNSVEITPTGKIPVLLACSSRECEGVAVHVNSVEEAQNLGCLRELGVDALRLFVHKWNEFKRKYGNVSDNERTTLLGILLLTKALKAKDAGVLNLAVDRLTASGPIPELRGQILRRQPGIELGRGLARGLRSVELILWRKDDGANTTILPGLRCPTILTALYVLAVMRAEGGEGIGACLNCGAPFIQLRKTRRTCSGTCRYALHMKRKELKSKGERKTR